MDYGHDGFIFKVKPGVKGGRKAEEAMAPGPRLISNNSRLLVDSRFFSFF
jgi:hypothetical protein